MPDSIAALAHREDDGTGFETNGHGLRTIVIKPGNADIQTSPNIGLVIIQDDFFAIDLAGKLSRGNLDLSVFEAGCASVGDGDSPQHY